MKGADAVWGALNTIADEGGSEMIELQKGIALAEIAISTAAGMAAAWQLGPVLGPPGAAIVLAAGLLQAANVMSAKKGGGPSGSGSAGGGPVGPPAQESYPVGPGTVDPATGIVYGEPGSSGATPTLDPGFTGTLLSGSGGLTRGPRNISGTITMGDKYDQMGFTGGRAAVSSAAEASGGVTIHFSGPVMGDQNQAREFAAMVDRELLKLRQANQSLSFAGIK